MKNFTFIAHRGASKPTRRENSVPAFERAVGSGRFGYIELDVRRTRTDDDGERVPIVAHDALTDRLYDLQRIPKYQRTHQGVRISSLSYNMLRSDSLEIATLREALRALNGHKVVLEIKDIAALADTLEVIDDVVAQVSNKWKYENIVISSFDWSILYKTREINPEIKIGFLYGFRNLPRPPFRHIKKLDATFVHMNKWLSPILSPYLAWRGVLSRYIYTVKSGFEVRLFSLFGVNGFTTDSITLPDEFYKK